MSTRKFKPNYDYSTRSSDRFGERCLYIVKYDEDFATLIEHEALPYEVAKTLSILSNDQDCSLELLRNTVWSTEVDHWRFEWGGEYYTGYSERYPDGLIMPPANWICNLFNHYTKTL